MKFRPSLLDLAFVALALLAVGLRLAFYEPLDLSVSNHDSPRYAKSSQRSVFSAKFYTNERQPTVALLYSLLEPEGGYEASNLSSPGDQIQPPLAHQPGYDRIAVAQASLSMLAWLALAWVVFRNLRQPAIKLLGAALVLLFAFTPQMAEWDYVMLTEPISLALFVLLLALSIEIVAQFVNKQVLDRPLTTLIVVWTIIMVLWVFTRDTNTYMLLAILGAFMLLAIYKPTRRKLPWRPLLILSAVLIALLLVATRAAQLSGRWVNPYFNNLLGRVLPVPEYRAFFEERGLPVTPELMSEMGSNLTELSLLQNHELVAWTEANGPAAYIAFTISHPAWAWDTFVDGFRAAFTENVQPFFRRNSEITSPAWVYLGNLLHPLDANIIFVVIAQQAVLVILAARLANGPVLAISGLFIVFLLGELAMLYMSIHGDAGGIVRHAMGSVIPLRLTLWLLPPFILDAVLYGKAGAQ